MRRPYVVSVFSFRLPHAALFDELSSRAGQNVVVFRGVADSQRWIVLECQVFVYGGDVCGVGEWRALDADSIILYFINFYG